MGTHNLCRALKNPFLALKPHPTFFKKCKKSKILDPTNMEGCEGPKRDGSDPELNFRGPRFSSMYPKRERKKYLDYFVISYTCASFGMFYVAKHRKENWIWI